MNNNRKKHGFFRELQRREVFSSAAYYFAIAWGGIEILEWVLERWQVSPPEWLMPLLATALVVGFPVTMLLAWMYDFDRSGIHRTEAYGRKGGVTITLALILMLGGTGGLYYLIGSPEAPKPLLPPTLQPKLAVLPFDAFSTDPEKTDFADAIHNELLNNLARLNSLMVISRQSVMDYRNSGKSIPEIALELGVDALLTGAVQRAGDRVRISLSLRDGKNDRQVWSDDFDFEFSPDRYFEVQTEIAETITDRFQVDLTERDRIRIGTAPTRQLTAFDAYLMGSIRMAGETVEGGEAARELFENAIRIDPEYALAYIGLFDTYRVLSRRGAIPMEEAMEIMDSLVNKALELDERLPDAWRAVATYRWRSGDYVQTEVAFQRVLELDPNNARGLAGFGYFLYSKSKQSPYSRELILNALELLERAWEINPRSSEIAHRLAGVMEDMGRIEEAIRYGEKAVELQPGSAQPHIWLSFIYHYLNDYRTAWQHLLQAMENDPHDGLAKMVSIVTAEDLQDEAAVRLLVSDLIRTAGEGSYFGCQARIELAAFEGHIESEYECLSDLESSWYYRAELRDIAIANNQANQARAMFERTVPHLLEEQSDPYSGFMYRDAIDLYPVLIRTGEQELADRLLDKALEFVQGHYRMSTGGYEWADVEIYALRGETEKALNAMREAVDAGLRHGWWLLPRKLNLQSLWEEPEFKAMMTEMDADMAGQREIIQAEFGKSLGLSDTGNQ